MAKHECPDCGASHEMSAEGRIAKLEERVKELEAKQHVCPHPHYWWYPSITYPTYYPTWTDTATQPNTGPVTVWNTSTYGSESTSGRLV